MRYYGGTPEQWARRSARVVGAFLSALPRLQAREDLRAISVAAVAGGRLKKGQADKRVRELRRAAGYESGASRPKTVADLRRHLAASGIGFREVPRK